MFLRYPIACLGSHTPLLNSANNDIMTQSTPFCHEPLHQFVKAIASIRQQCEFYDDILRSPKHPEIPHIL